MTISARVMPCSALLIEATSDKSPRATSTVSQSKPALSGRLTRALKGVFDASSARAAAEPTRPVAPISKIIPLPSLQIKMCSTRPPHWWALFF